jgi:hypothetical protein
MTPWKSSLHGVLSTTLMLTLANRGFTLVILPVIYGPAEPGRLAHMGRKSRDIG